MPYVEVSRVIADQDAAIVYEFICDMEKYPQFMENLDSVKILERTENTTITEWKTNVSGMKFDWIEHDFFDSKQMQINYEQIKGDLATFSGQWLVEPVTNGVRVVLSADFSLGIPMLAPMLHPLLELKIRENCLAMLGAIEKELCKSVDSGKGSIV